MSNESIAENSRKPGSNSEGKPQSESQGEGQPLESPGDDLNSEPELSIEINGFAADEEPPPQDAVGREQAAASRESDQDVEQDDGSEEPLDAVILDENAEPQADDFFELVPQHRAVEHDRLAIQRLQDELNRKSEEAQSNFDRLVRLQAEFENFKKRSYKEKQDFKKYCMEGIILEMLPNLDNLERGLKSAEAAADVGVIIEGIKMIHRNLQTSLNKFGLREIDTKERIFNPMEHEAMMIIDSTEKKNNIIIEEFQKGYFLNDRVIRPALVSVARQVAAVKEENGEPEDQIDEAMKEITSKLKLNLKDLDSADNETPQSGERE